MPKPVDLSPEERQEMLCQQMDNVIAAVAWCELCRQHEFEHKVSVRARGGIAADASGVRPQSAGDYTRDRTARRADPITRSKERSEDGYERRLDANRKASLKRYYRNREKLKAQALARYYKLKRANRNPEGAGHGL